MRLRLLGAFRPNDPTRSPCALHSRYPVGSRGDRWCPESEVQRPPDLRDQEELRAGWRSSRPEDYRSLQIDWLSEKFENATITAQLYNDLDQGIDYGCVFTTGCFDECNRCPLCVNSKNQLVDVLSGSKRDDGVFRAG
uniref:Secreted protein n=1 Tax=Steinernema glaseri TaxID=37863 RepID=A0A1I7Z7N6_9BILA